MFPTVILSFSEAFCHLLIAHFHRFRLGINGTVWQHTVHLAFIITDDCDLILKGHIFFNIAADNFLHCFKVVLNFNHLRVLVRLNKQYGNHIFLFRIRKSPAELTVLRLKIYGLKADAVAEIKAMRVHRIFHNLHHIGHRKGTVFVPFGVVQIKHLIHIFEGLAVNLAVKNLIVDFGIDSLTALQLFQKLVSHKGDIVGVTLHINLINSYIHRSKLLCFDL